MSRPAHPRLSAPARRFPTDAGSAPPLARARPGSTLLELLLVVVVVAVLVGLLLPAVQRVREAAARVKGKNQLRQIGVGLHNYAAARGRLPGFVYPDRPDSRDRPPLSAILPFVEATPDGKVALYVAPSDPTADAPVRRGRDAGDSSYAVNKIGFAGLPDPAAGFPDGASNTIAVAEHYARCGPGARFNFLYSLRNSSVNPPDQYRLNEQRRASFADVYYGDVVPVPDGPTSVRPSRGGATFQLTPPPEQCDPLVPQTAFAGGMPVLLFDASVRTVRAGLDPSAFWAAVTPAGGETVSLD